MKMKKKSDSSQNVSMLLNEKSPFALKEAYAQIRTNLMFSVGKNGKKGKVFAITSAVPDEGKSITAANLAVSFALLGKRTLLLDCDMRKPTQNKIWNIPLQNGFSNLLSDIGECRFQCVDEIPLTIISAGDVPPNPSELLSSNMFKQSINYFRDDFEYIIIDTPPATLVSDSAIISANCDGIVLVALSEKTDIKDFLRATKSLEHANSKICGYILNGLDIKKAKQGGYSKYNYKYNYYSYSEKNDD